jgi:hypothetical protein
MRTSFQHQPEAQHPNFPLSTSRQADYPIFRGQSGLGVGDGARSPPLPFHNLSFRKSKFWRSLTPPHEFARAGRSQTAVGHHVRNVPPAVPCPSCDDRDCANTFHIPNGTRIE